MASISGTLPPMFPGKGIPVSMGQEITQKKLMSFEEMAKDNPELLANIRRIDAIWRSPIFIAERVAELERQDAEKVHTVFRKDGKIVATLAREGGLSTLDVSNHRDIRGIFNEAETLGLQGEAMYDFISKSLEERLGLPALRFKSAAEAPTMGEFHTEMFGDWRGDPMRDPRLYNPVDLLA